MFRLYGSKIRFLAIGIVVVSLLLFLNPIGEINSADIFRSLSEEFEITQEEKTEVLDSSNSGVINEIIEENNKLEEAVADSEEDEAAEVETSVDLGAETAGTSSPESTKTGSAVETKISVALDDKSAGTSSPEPAKSEPVAETNPKDEGTSKDEEKPKTPSAPVSYTWGTSRTISFRSEVQLTNTGSEAARHVRVSLPMLENNSPYQTTTLVSTNYEVVSTSGRICNFSVGEIQPGETVSVIANYTITIRPVSINSTNETVEKAREIFQKHAGSGNCYTLAAAFVRDAKASGLKARVVNGFKRSQSGHIASGSLSGSRHSWAEFYVDGLGWVPVDLTFNYFADFPYASHIVETYADKNVSIYNNGGNLEVVWENSVL